MVDSESDEVVSVPRDPAYWLAGTHSSVVSYSATASVDVELVSLEDAVSVSSVLVVVESSVDVVSESLEVSVVSVVVSSAGSSSVTIFFFV